MLNINGVLQLIYTRYDTKTHQYRINGIMILWSRLLTQVLLLDFFKLVATNQIESFVSAPDFDKSCWFDNKFSLGFDFPNLPYFIDGDIKLTQVTFVVFFDIIALAPLIVKRLKEKKDGENDISDSRHHALHCEET